jgi:NitT/TauT family transport system substrate-binding protein
MTFARQKLILSFTLCVAIVLAIALLRFTPPTYAQSRPIRIAFNTWIGYSSFYIAERDGLFEKYRLNVKTSVIDPLAEKNAGMLRGDLEGMGGTIDSSVISATNGLPGTIVMMFDRSNGTDGILVTDQIRRVSDLIGKSIAVEEGFVGHFFLLYVLDKAKIDFKSIRLIPMSTDEAGAAFAAGKVDVAVTWEPLLTAAKSRPGAHVLVSSAEIEPILADTLFISKSVIKQRPNDIANLLRALMEANSLWKSAPDKYLPFIAEKWQLKQEEVAATFRTVQLYNCSDQIQLFGADREGSLYGFVSKASDLWLRAGVTKSEAKAGDLIDPAIIRQVCH